MHETSGARRRACTQISVGALLPFSFAAVQLGLGGFKPRKDGDMAAPKDLLGAFEVPSGHLG